MAVCTFFQRGTCKFGGTLPCILFRERQIDLQKTIVETNIQAASAMPTAAVAVAALGVRTRTASTPLVAVEVVTAIDLHSNQAEHLEV